MSKESEPAPNELLDLNTESAINGLIVFVRDGWPACYIEGAIRSLRRAIRERDAEDVVIDFDAPRRAANRTAECFPRPDGECVAEGNCIHD